MNIFKLFCIVITLCMLITIVMVGCDTNDNSNKEPVDPSIDIPTDEPEPEEPRLELLPGPDGYAAIEMKNAESYMALQENYIILDVRRVNEFADGHIPNAINVPNEDIGTENIEELPNKNQLIFVYCQSGNRSKQAAKKLVEMGYSNIVEIGGIVDWTGDIVKEEIEKLQFPLRIPQADVLTYKFKFPPLCRKGK